MPAGKYTVLYEKDGIKFKLCKVVFASDGSYHVISPYHPEQKAALWIATVNYAKQTMEIPAEELVDTASVDDDDKLLKFTHHRSGFVQFSGQGILSGMDAAGNARGIGIMSWPLDNPVRGPAFGITIRNVEQFARADRVQNPSCAFKHEELTPIRGANVLFLEGHYFPALWRRFVQTQPDGTKTISVAHPDGAILQLKTLFPPERLEHQGFIGLELYTDADQERDLIGTFMLAGPTGNLRQNELGEWIAESVNYMYPRSTVPIRRPGNYTMAAVPAEPLPPEP